MNITDFNTFEELTENLIPHKTIYNNLDKEREEFYCIKGENIFAELSIHKELGIIHAIESSLQRRLTDLENTHVLYLLNEYKIYLKTKKTLESVTNKQFYNYRYLLLEVAEKLENDQVELIDAEFEEVEE